MDSRLSIIENEFYRIGYLPAAGGSIAFVRVRHRGGFVDLSPETPLDGYSRPEDCASFVLAPWSNRVRDGVFSYQGQAYRLVPNGADGTAIHGTARDFPWSILHHERDWLSLAFDSTGVAANFPFRFSVRLDAGVAGSVWSVTTRLRNEDVRSFPAGFGHHPYFLRALDGGDDEVELEVPCDDYYPAIGCLPTGAAAPVTPRVDFRRPRLLGPDRVDDCLTGRRGAAPIRFFYRRAKVRVEMQLDPLYSHVILYVPDRPVFAVEPATHCNDAFNLSASGVPGTGSFDLEPGEERGAQWSLRIEDIEGDNSK